MADGVKRVEKMLHHISLTGNTLEGHMKIAFGYTLYATRYSKQNYCISLVLVMPHVDKTQEAIQHVGRYTTEEEGREGNKRSGREPEKG